jgi:cell filamentation protein
MSPDPYVYSGTTVLKNIPGIHNQEVLDQFEADRVGQRSLELIEYPLTGLFDITHLRRIHRYLFQDVYEWAGHFRTVDIAKGNSYFAHMPYIESTLKGLFEKLSTERHLRGLNQEGFARRGAERERGTPISRGQRKDAARICPRTGSQNRLLD